MICDKRFYRRRIAKMHNLRDPWLHDCPYESKNWIGRIDAGLIVELDDHK